jgi:peroxiredoxin
LADYAKSYDQIRALRANVVAVSVDPPERSEAVRRELRLPFAILCDTEHRVVQDWDIYNAQERGGIPKPCVFVIDRGGAIRYFSLDGVAKRVPASEILRLLQSGADAPAARRKVYMLTPGDVFRALRDNLGGGKGKGPRA